VNSILGSPAPHGILGGPASIRQYSVPAGSPLPIAASPFAMPASARPPAYGSDAWALATGGPGAMIWREMARAMSGSKHPLAFLDPSTKAFSPELLPFLGPQFQRKQGK
jgi:hypothetical protein